MRVILPRIGEPIDTDSDSPVARPWWQFMRELVGSLGFINNLPIFDQAYADGLSVQTAGALVTIGTVATSLRALFFPAGTDETVYFSFRMPNNYVEGSNLVPFVDWTPTDATTGNVVWQLGYSIAGSGDTLAAATTESITDAAGGTSEAIIRTDFTAITGTTVEKGDMFLGSLQRTGSAAADTYANNAAMLGLGFKFQIEGTGTETTHP